MNDMTPAAAPTAAAANSLWAVVGVLGVAVVALGSALYFVQTQKEELRVANNASGAAAPVTSTSPQAPESVVEPHRPDVKKQPVGQTKHADQAAMSAVSAKKPAVASPAREVCLNCGTVTASTPIEREGTGSGAGAVAGGLLGALLGNQVGQGQGKDVATVIGAVGGGIAGNTVEKRMKKQTVFQVQVRLDDGSTRTLEQAEPVGVGERVRVEGETLQLLPASR